MLVDPTDIYQAKVRLSHIMANCDNQTIKTKANLLSVEVFINEGLQLQAHGLVCSEGLFLQALGLLGCILP